MPKVSAGNWGGYLFKCLLSAAPPGVPSSDLFLSVAYLRVNYSGSASVAQNCLFSIQPTCSLNSLTAGPCVLIFTFTRIRVQGPLGVITLLASPSPRDLTPGKHNIPKLAALLVHAASKFGQKFLRRTGVSPLCARHDSPSLSCTGNKQG